MMHRLVALDDRLSLLAALLSWQVCHDYCCGEEHAEVVWEAHGKDIDLTEQERAATFRAWLAGEMGVDYLGHETAPEAIKEGEMETTMFRFVEGIGPIEPRTLAGDIREGAEQRAFLLRFRTALPLTKLRAMIEGGAS